MRPSSFIINTLLLICSLTSTISKAFAQSLKNDYYFPPKSGDEWLTKTAASINWDEAKLQDAFDFAATKKTYGLIVLHHGKIVKEQYWNGWNKNTKYYIASAGKSVTALLIGIAQQDGILNINDKVSKYLGTGWTSETLAKENLITIRHLLTMTSGLDDKVTNGNCTNPSCLIYKADAGTRWAYHNAPYHLLHQIIENASGKTWNAYCKEKLFDRTGLNTALWFNHIMFCTTREAARFGSLILNKGIWDGQKLLSDVTYFNAMTTPSQNLNIGYGYLWWLNSKPGFMLPQSQVVFPIRLVPGAPADMIMALGKDDKKIYVIPSLDIVVVRLGDNAGLPFAGYRSFDNELWTKLKVAMK